MSSSRDGSWVSPPFLLALGLAIAGSGLTSAGCQGASDPAAYQAKQIASVQATLEGTWTLGGYQPDITLEPMLDLWLRQEMPSLVVRFDHGMLRADSNVSHFSRGYSIKEVNPPFFKLVTTSNDGLSYDSDCEVSEGGNKILFHGLTAPWKGTGTLLRRSR